MVNVRLPLFAITHKDAVDVSQISMARFTGEPKWIATPIDIDGRQQQSLALFSTLDNAMYFMGNMEAPGDHISLELERDDLLMALRDILVPHPASLCR